MNNLSNCWKLLKTTHYKVSRKVKLDSLKSCGIILLLTIGATMDNQQAINISWYHPIPFAKEYLISEDGFVLSRRTRKKMASLVHEFQKC